MHIHIHDIAVRSVTHGRRRECLGREERQRPQPPRSEGSRGGVHPSGKPRGAAAAVITIAIAIAIAITIAIAQSVAAREVSVGLVVPEGT